MPSQREEKRRGKVSSLAFEAGFNFPTFNFFLLGPHHALSMRRPSGAKLHSMSVEAPITKVINIILNAQENSPNYIAQALDKARTQLHFGSASTLKSCFSGLGDPPDGLDQPFLAGGGARAQEAD